MTVKELAAQIDSEALVSFGKDFRVRCRIVDARSVYGRPQVLVEPLAGEGSIWVESTRVVRHHKEQGQDAP